MKQINKINSSFIGNTTGRFLFAAAMAGALLFSQPLLAASGDAKSGASKFGKCLICHGVAKGQVRIGPNLFGIYNKPVGTVAGYSFSPAFKDWGKGKKWDTATLDKWIANPHHEVPSTKMSFMGVTNAQDRADIIAYMMTLK